MGFVGTELVVSHTAATQIAIAAGSPMSVSVRNHDGANSVFIGGDSTVTINGGANPGFEVKAGEAYGPVLLEPGVAIWGLAKVADVTLDVTKDAL